MTRSGAAQTHARERGAAALTVSMSAHSGAAVVADRGTGRPGVTTVAASAELYADQYQLRINRTSVYAEWPTLAGQEHPNMALSRPDPEWRQLIPAHGNRAGPGRSPLTRAQT